jgi:hypothetical protein
VACICATRSVIVDELVIPRLLPLAVLTGAKRPE